MVNHKLLGLAATRLRFDVSIQRLQARTQGTLLEQQVADRFSLPRDVLLVLGENERVEPLTRGKAAPGTRANMPARLRGRRRCGYPALGSKR